MLVVFIAISDVLLTISRNEKVMGRFASSLGRDFSGQDLNLSNEELISKTIKTFFLRDLYRGPWGETSRASDMYFVAIALNQEGIVGKEFVEKFRENYSQTAEMYKWT